MLTGIFPAIPTCFTTEGKISPAAQQRIIRFTLEAGAHGIVFPGVASEYKYLTPDERATLIQLLVKEVEGRVPLVAGISSQEPQEVIALGQEALRNGITLFMLMAPTHLGKDLAKQQAFFAEVTEALSGCNILLQNAPVPIGAGLDADLLIQIVSSNPSITYVKEETLPSGPTITDLLQAEIPHLKGVFGGGGARYLIDELNRGAIGAVPAAELTDLHVALFQAYQHGDFSHARELYRHSLPLLTAQKIYRMSLTKYVLHQRGVVDAQHIRAPHVKLDSYARQDIDLMLKDLQQAHVLQWNT